MNPSHGMPAPDHMTGMDYARTRMRNFGTTILVMGACFALYYTGFFGGGVEGPLTGSSIGDTLAGVGFNQYHLLALFATLLLASVGWNWVYNLVCRILGQRYACVRMVNHQEGDTVSCGVEAVRTTVDGRTVWRCAHGHKMIKAEFRPVEKGVVAHTLWLIMAACTGILVWFIF